MKTVRTGAALLVGLALGAGILLSIERQAQPNAGELIRELRIEERRAL